MTVYVSYHDDDRGVVNMLKGALRDKGLKVIDRHSPELHWRAAIARCDAFVTFCSKRPVNGDELATALDRVRSQPCPVLTLKLEDCEVPEGLTSFPALTFNQFDELVQQIAPRIEKPPNRKPRAKKQKGAAGSSITIVAKNILAGEAQTTSRHTRIEADSIVVDNKLQLADGDE